MLQTSPKPPAHRPNRQSNKWHPIYCWYIKRAREWANHRRGGLDQDLEHLSEQPLPLRTFEMVVEAIYEAHIKPGWLLQPFFQYIFRPAGGIQNPYNPPGTTTRIGDAAVFALTSTIKY